MSESGVVIVSMGWVAGEHIRAWSRNAQTRVVGVVSCTRVGAERKVAEVGT